MAAVNRRGKIVALVTAAVGVVVLAAGTRAVQQILDRDPRIADPQSKKEFFIQIAKSDPKIDYKIVQIQPDPNVKYFLRVLDPEGKDTVAAVNSKLSAALQAKLKAAGSDPK